MRVPRVHYARRDDVSLAYQVAGEGPDVLVFSGAGCATAAWDDADGNRFFTTLSNDARVVTFDQRGAGRSDPLAAGQPLVLEERLADADAVAEAAGVERPFVLAYHDGGPVAILAAALRPEAYAGLVLVNCTARSSWAPDVPDGFTPEVQDWFLGELRTRWGSGFTIDLWAASWGDQPGGRERWARLEQAACSPGQAILQSQQTFATDVRDLLPLVRCPSLVVHRRGSPGVPPSSGRALADAIPDATLLELPGRDHMPFVGDWAPILGGIRSFFALGPDARPDPRRLAAVVFTDIVGSTATLNAVGDQRWVATLDEHDRTTAGLAARHGGRLVKSTGDGALAVFDGPARALRFALELVDAIQALGVRIRAGVHVGEVHERGDDVAGIAVHAAARVAALAGPDVVCASRTVVDLVAGADDLAFDALGPHELKGLDGRWELYAVGRP